MDQGLKCALLLLFAAAAAAAADASAAAADASAAAGFIKNASEVIALSLPSPALAGAWKDLLSLVDAHRGDSMVAIATLKSYFAQFGYLKKNATFSMDFDEQLESAVRLYQTNFGLPITGRLESNTIAQLVKPRCGREDVSPNGVSQMSPNSSTTSSPNLSLGVKHYAYFPGAPRWRASNLTFAFNESALLQIDGSTEGVKAAIRRGFDRWAAVVPLTFREQADLSTADISVEFAGFDHGDDNAFDGPLGILAHAFNPDDGRLHLDSSESWFLNPKRNKELTAVHLESVAVHEIGHLIGLGHSRVAESIMFPSIDTREVKTELEADDIQGAQALYGVNPAYQAGSHPVVGDTEANHGHQLVSSWSWSFILCLLVVCIM